MSNLSISILTKESYFKSVSLNPTQRKSSKFCKFVLTKESHIISASLNLKTYRLKVLDLCRDLYLKIWQFSYLKIYTSVGTCVNIFRYILKIIRLNISIEVKQT